MSYFAPHCWCSLRVYLLPDFSRLSETGPSARRLFHTPKLKARQSDGALDSDPREIVRRCAGRVDNAVRMPGRKLGGQFAALRIADERTEAFTRFGLENIDPHGSDLGVDWRKLACLFRNRYSSMKR